MMIAQMAEWLIPNGWEQVVRIDGERGPGNGELWCPSRRIWRIMEREGERDTEGCIPQSTLTQIHLRRRGL